MPVMLADIRFGIDGLQRARRRLHLRRSGATSTHCWRFTPGASLTALTEVASNNDIFGSNHWSRVRFTPVAGTTYRIAIDGNNGEAGNVYLHWVQRAGLPDLRVWGPSFQPYINVETFAPDSCAVTEGLIQEGTRKLIRLATESRNYGTADMVLGDPTSNPLFEYAICHGHFHFHDYVAQRLKSGNNVVATGLKVGHCLLDSIRWDVTANGSAVYDCGNQGIQKGWGDIYRATLDGQWVDITGVPPGDYTLEVEINFNRVLEESDFSNNVTQVPFTIPDPNKPQISAFSPANGATAASPAIACNVIVADGVTQLVTNSVQLFYDGIPVTPTITRNAGLTAIAYSQPGLLEPLSAHSVKLVFADNGSPPTFFTNIANFSVATWSNLYLPPALYLETFDSVAEGTLPAGWSVTNHTDTDVTGFDLNNSRSDAYKNWVVITRPRLNTQFPTNRLTPGPISVVNGRAVENLMQGKLIYAESDSRAGAQVQYLFSPAYNLTGRSNLWVSYHSMYTQNQDSIAALEYSVDDGANWLPVVYMLDGPDILRNPNGTIDAVATFTNVYPDVATYVDPNSGNIVGGFYGAFIAAPITQALSSFISARLNDDQAESKRVEFFPLMGADNKAKVRFRFAQAGSDSWYWGVDEFGIYSIEATPQPKFTKIVRNTNQVTLTWNGEIVSRLQKKTNLGNGVWQDIPGTLGLNSFAEPIGQGEVYYRLRKQ